MDPETVRSGDILKGKRAEYFIAAYEQVPIQSASVTRPLLRIGRWSSEDTPFFHDALLAVGRIIMGSR
jgi:hypothetical protein